MRHIGDEPRNRLALDFEESLEGFIQFLNWLSVVPYLPVIAVTAGAMAGVLLGLVRLRSAGCLVAVLLALTWVALRWLGHRFLTSAKELERRASQRRSPRL